MGGSFLFAMFILGDTYVDAKTVKSSTWKFFKIRMSGGEVDNIFTTFTHNQ